MLKKSTLVISLMVMLLMVMSAAALAYNEAPELKELVEQGQLPPVEERLPVAEDIRIVEPVDEVGEYGGTINVLALNQTLLNDFQITPLTQPLLRINEEYEFEGNLAKGYDISDDYKTITLYLRQGVKWSDGHLFTADDILFQFEEIYGNDRIRPARPGFYHAGGEPIEVEKIDDYTVKFQFAVPNASFLIPLSQTQGAQYIGYAGMYTPKHYLEKWHPDYNDQAEQLAEEEGFTDWTQALHEHARYVENPKTELPKMAPWILKETSTTRLKYTRNPYYWKTDSEGNQLPYISEIDVEIVDGEVYQMKVMNGEADFAVWNVKFTNYPMYKQNEARGGYSVIEDEGGTNEAAVELNLPYEEPEIRELYQNIDFRRALSLGINREDINEAIFFGLGKPRSVAPTPNVSIHKEEWEDAYGYIAFDLERANSMLDELGLDEKNSDGFRLRPDGEGPLTIVIEYHDFTGNITPVLEMVKADWEEDLGIKTVIRHQEMGLFFERFGALDVKARAGEGLAASKEIQLQGFPLPTGGRGSQPWWQWLEWKHKRPDEEEQGIEPPEEIKEHYQRMQDFNQTMLGSEEYVELGREVYDFIVRNMYQIGTVGAVPKLVIISNELKNVPTDMNLNHAGRGQAMGEQYYFEK